jgi:hypothetical protein
VRAQRFLRSIRLGLGVAILTKTKRGLRGYSYPVLDAGFDVRRLFWRDAKTSTRDARATPITPSLDRCRAYFNAFSNLMASRNSAARS